MNGTNLAAAFADPRSRKPIKLHIGTLHYLDEDDHQAYLDATRAHEFELYIGSEPLALRAYREGAAGAITGLAGARPELFSRLRGALEAGDDAAAEAVQAEVAAAKAEVESEGSTVAAVKRRVAAQLPGYPPAPRAPFA